MAVETLPDQPLSSATAGHERRLYSSDQLTEHARLLASEHQAKILKGPNGLLSRLDENELLLREYNRATYAVDQARRITPASEWLVDNFYLIEEQVQIARRHLPRKYSRQLPRLTAGPSAGLPRVYDIVLGFVSDVDAEIELGTLTGFLSAYQVVTPLGLGELWAVPIMIRLALIENLRRITDRLTVARRERDLADQWAQRLELTAAKQPSQVVEVMADMSRADIPLTSSFVAEFYQRLSRSSSAVPIARNWLDQRLAELQLSVDQLVRTESQSQAADQVSVSHTITGLRMLGSWDWRTFVEEASLVERILRTDPADVYRRMDFSTRDRYRHVLEGVARHSSLIEADVAQRVVELAEECARGLGREDRRAHVGYYLVGNGQEQFERALRVRWPLRMRLGRQLIRHPASYYLGSVALVTALCTGLTLFAGARLGASPRSLALCALPLLLGFSQFAVAVVNWLSSVVTGPRLLARLDYSGGIPPESRTLVIVPSLVPDSDAVDHLLKELELHFLSNRDANLHFGLLSDFTDCDTETRPEDAELRKALCDGITALNQKYGSVRQNIFYLFHRPRTWNQAERRWMGYERKRGKIAQLNELLRGDDQGAFSDQIGDPAVFPGIKFVITLDADTQLPRNAAQLLAATLAHPLNRPRFDAETGIVVEGFGILQPRVSVSLPGANRSLFSRLYAGEAGIDPYTRAVSDVYQDVFEEGSFIGKGIYDVDAFIRALGERFPENRVLSHDLIESCHVRSALVTDVELFEEFPARYHADVKRRHRWIRGDWQIAAWLGRKVPDGRGHRRPNPISTLSQWKIFDNLRRSLVTPALLCLAVGSWFLVPALAGRAILLVLATIAIPTLLTAAYEISRKPEELPFGLHLRSILKALGRQLAQVVLNIAFLPYDAYISADAILRTTYRVGVSHRGLLEWVPSRQESQGMHLGLPGYFRAMWFAPLTGICIAVLAVVRDPWGLPVAIPLVALWILDPLIAWRISQPIAPVRERLSEDQLFFLRATARKTWHYFETFVDESDHHLPPDNFQEEPVERLATRTSPTNIGLALLSNLAARDFGYLSVSELLRRIRATLDTLAKLERYRGHFYNWYDTRSLQPLQPLYVSSVDSGNLAGHLLTLGPGLRELADAEVLPAQVFAGFSDTLGVLVNTIEGPNIPLERLCALLARPTPSGLGGRIDLLRKGLDLAGRIGPVQPPEASKWSQRLQDSFREEMEDVRLLLAGIDSVDPTDAVPSWPVGGPSLRELGDGAHKGPAAEAARSRLRDIDELAERIEAMAVMDFSFLYDTSRKLFATGYNTVNRRRDTSFYDLLASESRLTSYVAVAQGQVSQEHWFALSRILVGGHGEPTLASWSGSMFEYLMPMLVMPSYEHTLLDETCKGAVQRQIEYGRARAVPWGISESGYNLTDAQLNYQYRAFGVPGLGLKRGLGEDLVISPYSTVMSLMVSPREACDNLERLHADERSGAYGFYEAVDYTPSRVPAGQSGATVRSYMVHHHGMSFLALAYFLLDRPMQRRFMACPVLRSSDLLVQERVPTAAAKILSKELEVQEARKLLEREKEGAMRLFTDPLSQAPEVHLLSNGRYSLAISQSGGGYSRRDGVALNRWREDSTRDAWGVFIYLRDAATGEYWSAAHQPVQAPVKRIEAIFSQGRAEFRHQQLGLEVHTEICVSPEEDVELRRVTITNPSHSRRVIEVTGYFEVALAGVAEEASHPAFSNLFVQTEFVAPQSAVLCSKRPRAAGEKTPWLFSLLPPPAGESGTISCETDRSRFLGRNQTAAAPAALQRPGPLANTAGSVLDPAVALRRTVTVPPGGEIAIVFVLGLADQRAAAETLIEKYQSPRVAARTFELAWTHSQVTLRQLDASEGQAQSFSRLASALIYAQAARRPDAAALALNRAGQQGLWRYGISGDLPIALVTINDAGRMPFIHEMVQAHAYWRMKGLPADLVVLNGDDSTYRQPLQDEIVALIASGIEAPMLGKPGGIFVLRLDQMPPADRTLLQAVARISLQAEAGALAEQLDRVPPKPPLAPALRSARYSAKDPQPPMPARELIHQNGLGGFTPDGREYVISLAPGQSTPAPWINVIANAGFGTIVSEQGSSYSWAENCHEYRLTPWANDPVSDPSGEALYLRDEETGQFWSPSPGPARGATPYTVRHGFGYTVFEHTEQGLASELIVFVAPDAPVKLSLCKVRNLTSRPRKVTLTAYSEWVLGDLRPKSLLHVQTSLDSATGSLLARNRYQQDFADRIAFADAGDGRFAVTGDRLEFIGRGGTLARPAALQRTRLSGRVGAGFDPAGALQVTLDLAPGQTAETSFRLGAARSEDEVQALVRRFRAPGAVRAALEATWAYWGRTLGTVNVDTPDTSVNMLANGWLLYQTLACRLWARSGFYQSGGAFGFRDQLQDVMALVHAEPSLTRSQLLLAASRQFPEGDVQHWWHPPSGRGVRTRVSDDYLWLPYASCRYADCVGDTGVWDESAPFLSGRPLKEHEESYYDLPGRTDETASLYEHCARAVDHGLRLGSHGLPLMGSGDWNDGMNLVGIEGRGESVWLAFFLCDVLRQFAPVAEARGDTARVQRYADAAGHLRASIDREAWDGDWYRRAFFDDGSPLGSAVNPECQMDSLPQSWSVLSGAGEPAKVASAMKAVDTRLVRREAGLIQLFDPPFDKSALNPGYIKGYIPGVRENGGQYTHAAVWMVMACALRGDHDRAWELFQILNPVRHGGDPAGMAVYKVEPYVISADVYALPPHTGRGGWSWYTGSAGWTYRMLVETLLGVNRRNDRLELTPRLPSTWATMKIHYRFGQTVYHITYRRSTDRLASAGLVTLDDQRLEGSSVPMQDDGREHVVEYTFAAGS